MTHEEFIKALCGMIGEFITKEVKDTIPCFCIENEIAKLEIENGTWRINKNVLILLSQKLGVELPKE